MTDELDSGNAGPRTQVNQPPQPMFLITIHKNLQIFPLRSTILKVLEIQPQGEHISFKSFYLKKKKNLPLDVLGI